MLIKSGNAGTPRTAGDPDKPDPQEGDAAGKRSSESRAEPEIYVDKNQYFQFVPPKDWMKKEFDDPKTKVSFYVPSSVPGQNKA
ncbi:MAG: hypothetical protein V1755_13215, partial [Chloroflexota bacterium]